MLASGHVVHDSRARLRIKIPARRGAEAYFVALAERLGKCPGVRSVRGNPLTASVLVLHETTTGAIAEFAEREGLFRLTGNPGSPPPLLARVSEQFRGMDAALRACSGGYLDAAGLAFLALMALAVYQLRYGAALPSATTLFWYGVTLMVMLHSSAQATD